VRDDNSSTVTVVGCTNVSGVTVTVRFLALNPLGVVAADQTFSIPNGDTRTVATGSNSSYNSVSLNTGVLNQGAINVESTNAAVFCTAATINRNSTFPDGVDLHVVRVNAAPGTVG
jgi:hypothetical protein